MYKLYTEFEGEIDKMWSEVISEKPHWYSWDLKLAENKEFELKDGWAIYCNTRGSSLSELLLGDVKMRGDIGLLRNFGATSGSRSTIEHGSAWTGKPRKSHRILVDEVLESVATLPAKMRDYEGHLRRGSVLNDAYWWPFKNDAWVVGGVHGLKLFHLALGSVEDDLLWDDAAGRPRVLGRELIGIYAFGYKRISHTRTVKGLDGKEKVEDTSELVGMAFAPQDKKQAQGATFIQYHAALKNFKDLKSIRDQILTPAVAYADYDYKKVTA